MCRPWRCTSAVIPLNHKSCDNKGECFPFSCICFRLQKGQELPMMEKVNKSAIFPIISKKAILEQYWLLKLPLKAMRIESIAIVDLDRDRACLLSLLFLGKVALFDCGSRFAICISRYNGAFVRLCRRVSDREFLMKSL